MLLKCLIDHTYQDLHAKAGEVYEVDDALGARLLRDFGGLASSEDAKRGNAPKFEATTERPTDPDKPEGEAPEVDNELPPEGEAPEADPEAKGGFLCNYPVGNGSCVLPAGHAGAHRLTAPDEEPEPAETPPPTRSGR